MFNSVDIELFNLVDIKVDIIEYIFENNLIDIKKIYEALYSAYNRGHYEIVEFLISEGAVIDNSMLVITAYQGHLDVVKHLVLHGLDISHHDFYALQVSLEVVENLIRH